MNTRVAIITGAAGGIGASIAAALIKEGTKAVITDFNEKQGKRTADSIGAHFIHADLTLRQDCQRVVDETITTFGQIDILVNNAGVQNIHRVQDFPEDTWEKMIALMLTAPFLLTKYAWPSMQQRGWGRIVNVASVHGLVASPAKSAYISAKHGLLGLTRTTALEGGAHGITVNAICPAYVNTNLVQTQIAAQAQDRGITEDEVVEQVMLNNAAIKHLIEPEEVADLVVYLSSDKARSVTGASWTIDLGWTAQ